MAVRSPLTGGPPHPVRGSLFLRNTSREFQTPDKVSDMPKPRHSDDPNALTEQVHGMVTKAERAKIEALAAALGGSLSGAVRLLIRAGFETDKIKSFTPQETDTP